MDDSLVSIIIPVYNREKVLAETLDSILSQTHQQWECILVDDGSTDSSVQIMDHYVKRDSRFKFFRRPEYFQKGAPSCRNYGYEVSSGFFIQWFDSDDIMRNDMIELKVQALSKRPDWDFIVAKYGEFLSESEITYPKQPLYSAHVFYDFLRFKIRFHTSGPLFRRTYLQDKILFSIGLKRHQEWEFFMRLLLNNPCYGTVDEYLCLRRIHKTSIRTSLSLKEEKLSYIQSRIGILKYALSHKIPTFFSAEIVLFYKAWSRSSIKYFFQFYDINFIRCCIQIRMLLINRGNV